MKLRNYIKYFKLFNYEIDEERLKDIIIFSGPGWMFITPLEIIFYHVYRKLGYDVHFLVYPDDIPIVEFITKKNIDNKNKILGQLSVNKKYFLNLFNVVYTEINYESFFKEKDFKNVNDVFLYESDGIKHGLFVKDVMHRYEKSLNLCNCDKMVAINYLNISISNLNFIISYISTIKNLKCIMMSHGIYVTWSAVEYYCKLKNINYICYDRGKEKGTFNINKNQISPDWSFDSAWNQFIDRTLTLEEEILIDEYLDERELQKNDFFQYNSTCKVNDIDLLKQRLGIKKDTKVVTFFTNLIWDAANVSRDIVFESFLDCIVKTIEKCGNENITFLLRPHPAEKVLGTNERYQDLLKQYIIDEKIILITDTNDINSFDVIELTDVGIVNTSTVGIELAIKGKPAIITSKTHYRGKGFTFNPVVDVEYFNMLEKLIKNDFIKIDIHLAKKYFFMMMCLYQQKFPIQYNHNNVFIGFDFNNFVEYFEYNKSYFENLIDFNNNNTFDWK